MARAKATVKYEVEYELDGFYAHLKNPTPKQMAASDRKDLMEDPNYLWEAYPGGKWTATVRVIDDSPSS